MDSRDNFILTTTRFDSKRDFSIAIPTNVNKSLLFSVLESDDVKITNNSYNHDIFIEDIENGGEIQLSYGQTADINDSDHPYPAMEYRIRIFNKTTGKSNLYLYKISHLSSTTDTQYKTMVASIGQYDENLLYEQDAKYLSGKRIYNSGYRSLQTLISIINDNSGFINYSLNMILNNPLLKDKRIVSKSPSLKRQSARSLIKNERSISDNSFYSSQIIQYADFGLNKYLIYMLRFSKIRLGELKKNCKSDLVRLQERLNTIIKNSNPDPNKRKKHTAYQIDNCNRRIERIRTFLDNSKNFLYNIDKIFESDVFKGIEASSKREQGIVYQHHYLNIERQLYLPLFQGFAFSFANTYGSILSTPIKQTSKLFEAYCLLSLDAAISELGFADITEELDYDHIIKKFVRDNYEIELMYEIDAKDVSIVNKGDIYYINSETRHISPDFYLILKRDNFPICFIVFDAKCRKVEAVNKDIVEGKYEKTIRDYLSLRYSSDENPFFLPKIVDTLWFLMPDNDISATYSPIHKLEYKFAKLQMDGNEDSFISDLEDYISMFLE